MKVVWGAFQPFFGYGSLEKGMKWGKREGEAKNQKARREFNVFEACVAAVAREDR